MKAWVYFPYCSIKSISSTEHTNSQTTHLSIKSPVSSLCLYRMTVKISAIWLVTLQCLYVIFFIIALFVCYCTVWLHYCTLQCNDFTFWRQFVWRKREKGRIFKSCDKSVNACFFVQYWIYFTRSFIFTVIFTRLKARENKEQKIKELEK